MKNPFRDVSWGRIGQVGIVFSLGLVLLTTIRDLRGHDFTILPTPLAASLVFGLGAILSLVYLWYLLIARISSQPVSFFVAVRTFAHSWLGRYLPGRIWSSVGKVYVGSRFGLSTSELTLASVLEQVFSSVAHVILTLCFVTFLFSGNIHHAGTLVAVSTVSLIFGVLLLHPLVLQRIVNVFVRRLGCGSLEADDLPNTTESAFFVLAHMLPLILYASSFWFIVVAIDPTTQATLTHMMGLFTIGSFAGKLSFVLPAGGIGVREAALVFLLQPTTGLPLAIVASLVSRLVLAVTDVFFVSTVSVVERLGIVGSAR